VRSAFIYSSSAFLSSSAGGILMVISTSFCSSGSSNFPFKHGMEAAGDGASLVYTL
jgi:hypothetical protein